MHSCPEGEVGPQPHDHGGDERGHGGREDQALVVESRGGQDIGVHRHDVAGSQEGRAASKELGGEVGAALGDLEELVDARALRANEA